MPLRFFPWIGALLVILPTVTLQAEEMDVIQGYWEGEWMLEGGGGGKQTANVVALGGGEYSAAFTAYDGSELQNETFKFSIRGTLEQEKVSFATQIPLGEKLGTFDWNAEIRDGKFTGSYTNKKNYTGTFALKRVVKKLERVGAKPLPGALVLLGDEGGLEAWRPASTTAWQFKDGILTTVAVKDGQKPGEHLASKEAFEQAEIHLEFRTPLLPEAREAERAQSGVFLQGRYEIQILDSFGEDAGVEIAGSLFGRRAPEKNVTLPPGEWQAFDISFTAPKFDASGELKSAGEITVRHNDVLIHERVPLEKPTSGAPLRKSMEAAGLILENAGQAVEFRNVWVVKLN